jgi:hypothetical protein
LQISPLLFAESGALNLLFADSLAGYADMPFLATNAFALGTAANFLILRGNPRSEWSRACMFGRRVSCTLLSDDAKNKHKGGRGFLGEQ